MRVLGLVVAVVACVGLSWGELGLVGLGWVGVSRALLGLVGSVGLVCVRSNWADLE